MENQATEKRLSTGQPVVTLESVLSILTEHVEGYTQYKKVALRRMTTRELAEVNARLEALARLEEDFEKRLEYIR